MSDRHGKILPMNEPTLLDPSRVASELMVGVASPAPAAPVVTFQEPTPPAASRSALRDKRPFDAARFKSNADGSPFVNRAGFYMPKGGKGAHGSAAAPAAEVAPASAPAVESAPAAAPAPVSAAPSAPAWSEAEKAAAAQSVPAEAVPGSGAVPDPDITVDHSADAAEAICGGAYLIAGVTFDASEDATPGKQEHENLRNVTAAWIRSTGWKGGPLAGMLLGWAAYLMRLVRKPKPAAKMREWFGTMKRAQPVDVETTPVRPAAPKTAPVGGSVPAAPPPGAGASLGFGGLSER